ncbi:MAG: hypothetical protein Q8K82_12700 [Gemmatimonadaceae bacterium]|nr:hypothetical protein [Gemmatimonadaceae bacterium]
MRTLTEIMNESGSDKGTKMEGWDAHLYTPHYEQWFDPIRERPLRLLEIGVCDPRMPGASLNGWREYFPNATIFGFDIVDATRFDGPRVTTFMGDQSSASDLSRFIEMHGTDFDIIVDDGSHVDRHQQVSFAFLFDHLKTGGQYIVEDMQVSPDTVQVLYALQRRLDEPVLLRSAKDGVHTVSDLILNDRNAPKHLPRATITQLSRQIASIEILCDEKLARIVKR